MNRRDTLALKFVGVLLGNDFERTRVGLALDVERERG
jgi:hypothetical protein